MDQPADPLPPAITDQPNHDINVDFARDLLAATFETMPVRMNEDPAYRAVHEVATCTALKSMHARDPIELMFAAHTVAALFAQGRWLRLLAEVRKAGPAREETSGRVAARPRQDAT